MLDAGRAQQVSEEGRAQPVIVLLRIACIDSRRSDGRTELAIVLLAARLQA